MAKQKVVKQSANPFKGKVPKGAEKADQLGAALFRWRCSNVDLIGAWGFSTATCEQVWQDIIPRLHQFETMTWQEIISARSTSDHTMPVANVCSEAQERLKEIGLEQVENLFQLSLAGKPRLWSYKDQAVFYLIWFDPEHTVYPVEKRNT